MKTLQLNIAILLLLCGGILVTAQERETPPVSLEQVSESSYLIKGGKGANGGLIIGEKGVIVVDSKMDEESVKQTLYAIGESSEQPIQYLVNTHSDGDHILGNRFFPASLTFVAHENCRDDFFKVNFGRESDWDDPAFYPFTPSVTFIKNMNLWLGEDKVELYYFGVGHTTGDIFVYLPEDKVVFMGDLYFSGRPQLIHSAKGGNSFEYVTTLTKMLKTLDAEIFLSGHGDPVGRAEIETHIKEMVLRQEKVKELLDQDKTLEETLATFDENETRLVTSIYGELTQNLENPSPEKDPYKL